MSGLHDRYTSVQVFDAKGIGGFPVFSEDGFSLEIRKKWVFLSVWDNVLMTSGQLFRNYADSVLEIYGQDLCPKLPN